MKKSITPLVIAGKVKASDVRTVFLVSGKMDGKVQTVFTLWSALAAGVGVGAALFGLGKLFSRTSPAPSVAGPKAASRRESK
jgi:hypothetical protein